MSHPSIGFTLMELLVTITVIALLAAIVISSTGMVVRAARTVKCQKYQQQLFLATQAYGTDNEGEFPLYCFGEINVGVKWYDVVHLYLDRRGPSTAAAITRDDVVAVCPEYRKGSTYALPGMSASDIGYGVNRRLYSPRDRRTNYWPDSQPPGVYPFFGRFFWAQITHPTRRILYGDALQWLLDTQVHPTKPGTQQFIWFTGAPNRHGLDRAVFIHCDGHAATLREEIAAMSVFDPTKVP